MIQSIPVGELAKTVGEHETSNIAEVSEAVVKEIPDKGSAIPPDLEQIQGTTLEAIMQKNVEEHPVSCQGETTLDPKYTEGQHADEAPREWPEGKDLPSDVRVADEVPDHQKELPKESQMMEVEEFRPLTEKEAKEIQAKTGMSDVTIKNCTMNEDGVVRLKCRNEGKVGENSEVPYVQKTIEVNGVQIQVVVPEFPHVFEAQLPKELYKGSDAQVFRECTEQLREAIKNDSELGKQFTPQQLEQIMNGGPYIKGYSWHHCAECGKMQLVPTKLHATYGHTGGKVIWGGGR